MKGDRGDPGLAPPGYDLPPPHGLNQVPRRLVRAGPGDHCPNQLPYELQGLILCVCTLTSVTASSRAVGEPGTGAKVVQDRVFTGTGRASIPPDRKQVVVLTARPECPIDLVLVLIDDDLSRPVLVFDDPG